MDTDEEDDEDFLPEALAAALAYLALTEEGSYGTG